MMNRSDGEVRPHKKLLAAAVFSGLDRSVRSVLCGLVMAVSLLGVNTPLIATRWHSLLAQHSAY